MNGAWAILWSVAALMLVENPGIAGIHNPPPPEGGKEIAYRYLAPVPGLMRDRKEAPVSVNEMALSAPHQSYHGGLDDLAKGELLSKARLFTWRYLVLHGEKGIAEVRLNADEKAGRLLQFNYVSASVLPEATLIALREAEKLPQVKEKDYELRFLEVRSAHFWAIWLQRESEDILIPINDRFISPLKANKAYSEAEVIKVLKPKAEETIEMFKKAGPDAVGG